MVLYPSDALYVFLIFLSPIAVALIFWCRMSSRLSHGDWQFCSQKLWALKIQTYYCDYHHALHPLSASAPQPPTSQGHDVSPQKVNFTSHFKQCMLATHNELKEYFRLPQEDFDICNPLAWWAGCCSQFPNLSHFACDVFRIPGTTFFLAL